MWQIGKPPRTTSSTPAPAGAPGRPSGIKLPSRPVLLGAGAVGVVIVALIHRSRKTGSSNGASTGGGNPSTPMVVGPNGQGTYDSSGQDTANALLDMNTRLAGIGSALDALDPSKWPASPAAAGAGPSGVPAPGGTSPVPGSGMPIAAAPAGSGLPWVKTPPAGGGSTPAAAGPATSSTPAARPSTRSLSTFDKASQAKLRSGGLVVGGDGRTMKLVGGVPTTVSYARVAIPPKPAPPVKKATTLPPRRKA